MQVVYWLCYANKKEPETLLPLQSTFFNISLPLSLASSLLASDLWCPV
jgi:hypothetical protein